METGDQKVLQKHLIQFIVGDVFNTITEKDLLKVIIPKTEHQEAVWTYRGEKLTKTQVDTLRSQAKGLRDSEIWKILSTELRYHAQQRGLVKSKTSEDILASKLLLYLVGVIENKLDDMSK